MPTWGVILIVIAALVIVIVLLLRFVPAFNFRKEHKKPEEYAKETTATYIVDQREKILSDDEVMSILQKREKELDIILTDIDIESLIPQIRQDQKDSLR